MTDETMKKINKIIANNDKWPLILEGVNAEWFNNATILDANISSTELGIRNSETGFIYPNWLKQLLEKSKNIKTHNLLVIDKLENLDIEEQRKFIGLLKHKGVNGLKFPEGTQIIIVIEKGKIDKISKDIASLCIIYKEN